jgi:hypothetical protein
MEQINTHNSLDQILEHYSTGGSEDTDTKENSNISPGRERDSSCYTPKTVKSPSAMATIKALGSSMSFLGRKSAKTLEKSRSAMMLSTTRMSRSDSTEQFQTSSIFTPSEKAVPFDETASIISSVEGISTTMDAFRLFSNNVMTSVLITQVCVLYQDQSTNLRVSLNCSVLELVGTILSKMSMNGVSIGTNTNPVEFMLGKRDRNHPGMQIWMNIDHHALSYGILQGVNRFNQRIF